MPAISLVKMYLMGSAFSILVALYGLVDSVGGLMYSPTHHTEDEWTVTKVPLRRTTAKKHIGLR